MIDELQRDATAEPLVLDGRQILVLEDEPLILMQVCRALERVGATVFRARSGRTALSQLKQHGIEAAILDVNLGQGETCNEVASDLRTSGIPFCLFSGDLQGADELVSRLDAPLIRKPASNRTLVEGVSRLLEGI